MDDVWTLLLLSMAMLIGCYLAGCIPLAITLSEEKMKLVTVLGAGLLVGTALAVIIPEGVHTLYMSQSQHGEHHSHIEKAVDEKGVHDTPDHQVAADVKHEHGHMHPEVHAFIGVALVLGFIFMLLVDQLSGGTTHVHSSPDWIPLVHTPTSRQSGLSVTLPHQDPEQVPQSHGTHSRKKLTATLGLVVHAAADGVALGAAATTSQTHVEMIVFIAIMLHKAPAAFGLVSFLLHEGHDRTKIRKHLAVFSAAAPVLALITYFGLSQQSKETLSEVNATGVAMLFSAGTFLYVATVHVLPELTSMGQSKTSALDGNVIVREHSGFTKVELFTMVIGSLLPLILSLGHHH